MFVVVLLFVVATVAVPTVQALLASGAEDLPLGLSEVRGLVYAVTLVARRHRAVRDPVRDLPAGAEGEDAVARRLARRARRHGRDGIVDLGFPLYLDNISTLRVGTSAVFVLIALVWFYVIALILLAGAVVNELRFEHVSRGLAEAPG